MQAYRSLLEKSRMLDFPNNRPLVSIVIPTYQGEKFLEEALASVFAQTYPNLEVIISDDSSVDRTLEIVQNFQLLSPIEFKIFTHQRLGMIENWNFAISMARGKYIKFLFQDDILTASCIEDLVNLAERDEEIGLVFSPRGILISQREGAGDSCLDIVSGIQDLHLAWSKLESIQPGMNLLNDPRFLEGSINKIGEPSTVLIKKKVFDSVGLFDPNLCQLVDIDMWCRIMLHYKIGFVDKTLSYFRVHLSQQTMQNHREGKVIEDYQNFMKKMMTDPSYTTLPEALKEKIYLKVENERNELTVQRKQYKDRVLYLERREAELEFLLKETAFKLQTAEALIEGMESSKFWKLRTRWKQVKQKLGLPDRD